MSPPVGAIWPAAPHTLAKHQILRRYLQAWFPIIDSWSDSLIYLDGFCGPGRYTGGEPGSPIIALQEALGHIARLTGEVLFEFSDIDGKKIENLRSEILRLDLPPNFKVNAKCCTFEESLEEVLDRYYGRKQPPVFALIDPFGFKGLPYSLIKKLMLNESCECLITFMADPIVRFLGLENEIRTHIESVFGTSEAVDIALGSDLSRVDVLRELYRKQLSRFADFIRHFEMRGRDNKVIYYLFFASNHRKGFIKMKEAMWRVDPVGSFIFSDSTNPDQAVLFDDDTAWLPKAVQQIWDVFEGRESVDAKEVHEYMEEATAFIRTHSRAALRQLEASKRIRVHERKVNGTARHGKSFPEGVLMDFLQDLS